MSSTEQTRPPITVSEQAKINFVNTTYFTVLVIGRFQKVILGQVVLHTLLFLHPY